MYQEEIPTAQLVQKLASVIQEYTQSGWEESSEKKKENWILTEKKKKNIELGKKGKENWMSEKRKKDIVLRFF